MAGGNRSKKSHTRLIYSVNSSILTWPAWYIFSMVLLGLHLRHGAWSMFQSLGINHPRHTPILRKFAIISAVIITAGFISIPVSVLLGLIK